MKLKVCGSPRKSTQLNVKLKLEDLPRRIHLPIQQAKSMFFRLSRIARFLGLLGVPSVISFAPLGGATRT